MHHLAREPTVAASSLAQGRRDRDALLAASEVPLPLSECARELRRRLANARRAVDAERDALRRRRDAPPRDLEALDRETFSLNVALLSVRDAAACLGLERRVRRVEAQLAVRRARAAEVDGGEDSDASEASEASTDAASSRAPSSHHARAEVVPLSRQSSLSSEVNYYARRWPEAFDFSPDTGLTPETFELSPGPSRASSSGSSAPTERARPASHPRGPAGREVASSSASTVRYDYERQRVCERPPTRPWAASRASSPWDSTSEPGVRGRTR
jgi:hypothetical protein